MGKGFLRSFVFRQSRKIFIFRPPEGLTGEKAVYDGSREAAPPGPSFRSSAEGSNGWGRKKPRRERTGDVRPPSRARNQVREPRRRKTRAPAQARACTIRAQKGSRRLEAPGRRRHGRKGAERNATKERYAGTEPQSFGGGMGNMTKHDTIQGSFHEPPRPASVRGGRRDFPPASEAGRREGVRA